MSLITSDRIRRLLAAGLAVGVTGLAAWQARPGDTRPAPSAGQAKPPAPRKTLARGAHRIEITLERQEGEAWRAVDPGLVLDSGDRVRFRFRANFDGYLYVMNEGTSGAYTLLFPREETGRENNIRAGKEYLSLIHISEPTRPY